MLKNKKDFEMIYDFSEVDEIINNCIKFYKKQKYWYFKFKNKITFKIPSHAVEIFQCKYNFSKECFEYLQIRLKEQKLNLKLEIIWNIKVFTINYIL